MSHNARPGGSSEYGTPRHLFDYLNRRFQFDYDPFAAQHNRMPVRYYSTIGGTFDDNAARARAGHDPRISDLDGFDEPWTGRRVFFNPPYKPNGTIGRAVTKAVLEIPHAEIIVAILPVDPSTRWYQLLVANAHIEPLEGRPQFIDPTTGTPRMVVNPKTGAARPASTVPIVVAIFHPDAIAWRKHEPPMPTVKATRKAVKP